MLLVDTCNLYHGAFSRYETRIDYDNLIYYLRGRYPFIKDCPRYAYVAQTDQSYSFTQFMRSRQFIVRSKTIRENKLDTFDVELTVDALAPNLLKSVVICSASLNLLPLIQFLTDQGCIVNIHACGIPNIFREHCNACELPLGTMLKLQEAS